MVAPVPASSSKYSTPLCSACGQQCTDGCGPWGLGWGCDGGTPRRLSRLLQPLTRKPLGQNQAQPTQLVCHHHLGVGPHPCSTVVSSLAPASTLWPVIPTAATGSLLGPGQVQSRPSSGQSLPVKAPLLRKKKKKKGKVLLWVLKCGPTSPTITLCPVGTLQPQCFCAGSILSRTFSPHTLWLPLTSCRSLYMSPCHQKKPNPLLLHPCLLPLPFFLAPRTLS